ncbi:RIKEN cDNA 1810003N24, isoform CRA_a [Mus musculus]|nr:RIKEN cDNA 1810003N24, isoform CRA_a [Mus musculus]
METQSTGTEDGFTPVTHRGGRRAKKRQAEQSSAAGQDGEAGRMDTEEARPAKRPVFPPLSGDQLLTGKEETRKIPVPGNRYTPLKENWMKIFTPIVEHLGLQIRFNLKSRNVEIRTCKDTKDVSALTKAADFVKAFVLGFQVEVSDLMRLPDTQCGHFNGWVIFQTFRLFFVASEKFSFEMLSLFLPGVDLKRPSFLLSCRMHLPLSD